MLPPLRELILDYETYYDKDCSLTKLSYTDYVNHKDFFVWGASAWFHLEEPAPTFYNFVDLQDFIDGLDWNQVEMTAHNMHFDGYVLHRKYGQHPRRYSCTQAMSRAIHQGAIRNSLDAVMQHYGVGRKLGFLHSIKGKKTLTPQEWNQLAVYANNDAEGTGLIKQIMQPMLPAKEHDLIDLTNRMFCMPILQVNKETATEALTEEVTEKEALIASTGHDRKALSGDLSFADILTAAGVDPPRKLGKPHADGTPKEIYAFAKTDKAFIDLIEGGDPVAARLCQARQAVQSTGIETRANRLISEADRGELPVCLLYYGGHTGRWSGGNKTNLQNLKRGGKLRLSIEAPVNHVIVVQDASQIEVRFLYSLVGQEDGLANFRDGVDPYNDMASSIFNVAVDRKNNPEHETMGFLGKSVVLGCGFQMGPPKFRASLAIGAIGGVVLHITEEEAEQAVHGYRARNTRVVASWAEGKQLLLHMALGRGIYASWLEGVSACADTKRIYLPGGTFLHYPDLYWDNTERQFKYRHMKVWRKVYGGKVIENITQAVARNFIAEKMLNIDVFAPVVLSTHDEVGSCVGEYKAHTTLAAMQREMCTAPAWMPNIPLAAEGGFARNYSK